MRRRGGAGKDGCENSGTARDAEEHFGDAGIQIRNPSNLVTGTGGPNRYPIAGIANAERSGAISQREILIPSAAVYSKAELQTCTDLRITCYTLLGGGHNQGA